ncbi:MAG: ABC transporter ATP-binding protein [Syntrophothermus sp.]
MNNYQLKAENLTKIFGRRLIFKDLNFSFEQNGIYGIAGHNGSGKSTLVKIIAGIIGPSMGSIKHLLNNNAIKMEELHNHIGFVSPYLVLYDEFTAEENLRHFASIRGVEYNQEKVKYLFHEFRLYDRMADEVKGYSSGMKQRLKYIFALMHSPSLIILDEPTSNLDNAGKETVYKLIAEESAGSIVIVASNEDTDLALCSDTIQLEKYKQVSQK